MPPNHRGKSTRLWRHKTSRLTSHDVTAYVTRRHDLRQRKQLVTTTQCGTLWFVYTQLRSRNVFSLSVSVLLTQARTYITISPSLSTSVCQTGTGMVGLAQSGSDWPQIRQIWDYLSSGFSILPIRANNLMKSVHKKTQICQNWDITIALWWWCKD